MTQEETFTFWFDLETAPDVLFFEPIAKRLRQRNHRVHITCRDYSDVPDLARLHGIPGTTVGGHGGKHKIRKICTGLWRTASLARFARDKEIDLAVGFGSRPLALAAAWLGLPNASVFDYEHARKTGPRTYTWTFVPEEIPADHLAKMGLPENQLFRYHGLKEEVYTGVYQHNPGLLKRLGYDDERVIVTIRPPATKATYHEHLSDVICRRVLENIVKEPNVLALFLRRDGDATFDDFLQYENIENVTVPVKGLDLIIESDVVISGGGTMVREAAALGVPSYSIFAGKKGAVDDRLDREGKLVLIRDPEDVEKIRFVKRDKQATDYVQNDAVLEYFVTQFIRLAGGRPPVQNGTPEPERQTVQV